MDACTLPTAQRPLRLAEFDDLFATAVTSVERTADGRLSLALAADAPVAARAADLMVREAACCAFFTFTLSATAGQLRLEVSAPPERADVLDALAVRASARTEP